MACDGLLVRRVTSVKYLGIYLDEKMSGFVHAADVVISLSTRLSS